MKLSKRIQACGLSPIRKFHPYAVKAEADGKKIYHLNIGQPDIKTPEAYFEAVRNFSQPVLAYAPSPGIPEMLEAVRNYYEGIGVSLSTDDILITTGGSEALQMLMHCILDEGSEILTAEPFYPNYGMMIDMAGGRVVPIPTSPEEGYRYADRAKIEARITDKTRAILVTNPGNPTGVVLTRPEMELLLDVAREHSLYLICDEVYREFVYDGEPLSSFAQLPGGEDNIVVIDSVSKRFSACGARIGALISRNKTLMEAANKLCQARLSVATLDQVAAAALYGCSSDYFAEVRDEYCKRRDVCYEGIRKIPGAVCTKPDGAFYMMVKLPIRNAEPFQKWLLTEFEDHGETVMFAPGDGFYATEGKGVNEVRLAYVLDRKDLTRALELLAMAIEQYKAAGEPIPE